MGLDADALDQHDRLQEKVERIITQALQETAQRRLKTDCGHWVVRSLFNRHSGADRVTGSLAD